MAKSSDSGRRRGLPAIGARLLGAAVLLPLAIWLILLGGWPVFLLIVVWVLRLVWEYEGMRGVPANRTATLRNALLLVALLAAFWVGGMAGGVAAFTLIVMGYLGASALRGRIEGASARAGDRILLIFYLGFLPGHWILLRELPLTVNLPYEAGGYWLLYAAGLTWLSDTFAYIVGSMLGRHSLGSAVSPKKSVEGVIGGVVGTVLCAWLLAPYWAPFLAFWQILLVGVMVSAASQVGDLFESLLKRDAAIKDSGSIIPGHGGFLDRVDSLLFSLPVFYYFLRWIIF